MKNTKIEIKNGVLRFDSKLHKAGEKNSSIVDQKKLHRMKARGGEQGWKLRKKG